LDEVGLFAARSLPILPSVAISAFCGLVQWNLKNYLIVTFLGTLVRASIIGFVGWKLGELYAEYADQIDKFEKIGLLIVILPLVGWLLYRLYKKNKIR
jgi:membrane protein DedA with SNARE-associated domain